ncbi:Putative methyl-accepting chemotaxis AlkN [Planktothrix agardhii]|uniref:methyl-accepting chemotaxis protein n=2 Tax=Planktothrix agardhii TaxID=1160 RepID=UPI001D0AAF13|nr:methyl-accepting chemotaxis protein [Planktothrix agardhii]MCB8762649.1 methyl-accepting chemotaxis protein [Planktothrix agardhii 1809]MCB8776243.1 methyl-accepting chemotaxis protein [Planktothrix agardhii 1031]MCF3568142.1 methyl-accepting chemotaxis protein [Planktothrix agardhii 1807]MCF3591476.1 methyl-accepting chemotaxis protein [Planktothrix agardhii 1029]MCF3619058.1 methyl-accepting chemotaxis protein [Planktothrix agardhii 1030]MCF3647154.1 methyl-accepting chemotaxis protein [
MFNNFKLRERLLLGYSIPVFLFMGLTALVYSNINQVSNTFKEAERVQEVILKVNVMERGAQGMVRSLRGYLALKNQDFLTEYNSGLVLYREAAKTLESLVYRPEQKQRLQKLDNLVNEYDQMAQQVFILVNRGKLSEAIEKARIATQYVIDFDRISDEFSTTEASLLTQETTKAKESLNGLLTTLVFGALLILVTVIIIALLIAVNISGTIHQATQVIATSSTEIAATLAEQERTANQQASSVHETTTTMDELSASSGSTAEQAESATYQARQVLGLTEGGKQAVNSTLEGMENLQQKVEVIAQQIIRLSEQTNQIGNISELVSDLANQTNMLALNAAVEAVRAGEHGKGFAVVATEIRKLADESKKSAFRINTLVADILTSINSTVMATEEGTKTVISNAELTRETADTFAVVAEAVNNVVLNNQQISLNVKQQAIAIGQVLEAMNVLSQGVGETANGLNQAKIGMEKLNEVALNLNSIV